MSVIPDNLADTGYISVIRCSCGGRIEPTDITPSPDGLLCTVECVECYDTGGYNSGTLDAYGAVDGLEVIGGVG